MRLALGPTGQCRLAEASPHDKLWDTSSPHTWCGLNLLGQVLEHAREILRQKLLRCFVTSYCRTPRDLWMTLASLSCETDPATHIHLDTPRNRVYTNTATLSAFTDSVPDDYAPKVHLAHTQRVDAPLSPAQGSNLIIGVVTMDDPMLTILLALARGVPTTSLFNCRALVDTGSPQPLFHQGASDQMIATGASAVSYV